MLTIDTPLGSVVKNYDISEFKQDSDYVISFDVTNDILNLSGHLTANVKWKSNNSI